MIAARTTCVCVLCACSLYSCVCVCVCYLHQAFLSVLWTLPGFKYTDISLDLMHIGDLGIIQYLLGNVVLECFWRMDGTYANPKEAMADLTMLFKQASRMLKITPPFAFLTLGMFKQRGKDPCLRLKAAESRRALACCALILTEFLKPRNDHEHLVANCVLSLHNVYERLKIWSDGSASQCATEGRRFLMLYAQLNREGDERVAALKWTPYKFYPKFHLFVHLVEDQTKHVGNPRKFWCYGDEDAIGKGCEIAASGHCKYVHRACIDKYRL